MIDVISVTPFSDSHIEAAAHLLAARHRRDRRMEPLLPARFDQPEACEEQIRALVAKPLAQGVVALRAGHVAGFMLGSLWISTRHPRAAGIEYAGHAVEVEAALDIYHAMYAQLADSWVVSGCFLHFAAVPAGDRAALDAWFALGFGQENVRAARDIAPLESGSETHSFRVRQAGPADIDAVVRLSSGLERYETQSPMFAAAPPETMPNRAGMETLLADTDCSFWLAERDGHAFGLMSLEPTGALAALTLPDRCTFLATAFVEPSARAQGSGRALLAQALGWAQVQGFERCVLNFKPGNVLGRRFWLGQGFRPIGLSLAREVDRRIAWAHGG